VLHRGHVCTASHLCSLLIAGRRDCRDRDRAAAVLSPSPLHDVVGRREL
jgi:hypothetical protein